MEIIRETDEGSKLLAIANYTDSLEAINYPQCGVSPLTSNTISLLSLRWDTKVEITKFEITKFKITKHKIIKFELKFVSGTKK